jgi:hypothetical protein
MIEVYPNLFVGDQQDYELDVANRDGWAIVHACKEPYHRQALGYRGRGAPKDHPEYLVARRDHRLILNIVDANDPAFFAPEMINAALDFIEEALTEGRKVLVHCNEGRSRSPAIALLYMASCLNALPTASLQAAEQEFRILYPSYAPKPGIRGYLTQHWDRYCSNPKVL